MKPGHDGATPSGNSLAATVLQRLETLTGESGYGRHATDTLHAFQAQMTQAPTAFSQMLIALHYYLRSPREIALVGNREAEETRTALQQLWRTYAPNDVIALLDTGAPDQDEVGAEVPLLDGKQPLDGKLTYYVCESYTCKTPTTELGEVLEGLD